MDPTAVLKSLTDDFGNPVHIGEQRDIGEFNLNFLERVEEGLGERIGGELPESQNIDELSSTGQFRVIKEASEGF